MPLTETKVFPRDGLWPVELDGGARDEGAPAATDIDCDGKQEVVVFLKSSIHVIELGQDGQVEKTSCIKTLPHGYSIETDTVLADIDGDKDMEIICAPTNTLAEKNTQLIVLHHDGALAWEAEGLFSFNTPAVGDIDNDGEVEIVAVTLNGEKPRLIRVCAYGAGGMPVSGWPRDITNSVYPGPAVTLADLDNNGTLEIILTAYKDSWENEEGKGHIFVFTHDGKDYSGWPKLYSLPPYSWAPPAIGDVDNDGNPEIVIFGSHSTKECANEVSVFKKNGTVLEKWAVKRPFYTTPILLDLDNDGDLEILGATSDGNIFAWHHNADMIEQWQKKVPAFICSSMAAGDLDDDGISELVVNAGRYSDNLKGIFVWEIGECDLLVWRMHQHDAQHTGCYTPKENPNPPPDTNHPPTAHEQSVTTKENTPFSIILNTTDPDGDNLTYCIATNPAHGKLSNIINNKLTYTPYSGYTGSDSFTFKANDGKADSNIATVFITINNSKENNNSKSDNVQTP